MMCTSYNDKPCTIIVSCNSSTNASDETDITFYNDVYSIARHIPNHKFLIIGVETNVHIGKDEKKQKNNNQFC